MIHTIKLPFCTKNMLIEPNGMDRGGFIAILQLNLSNVMQITSNSIVKTLVLSLIVLSPLAADAQRQTVGEDIKSLYQSIFPLDLNKDAKISDGEKAELAKAMENGTLPLPRAPKNFLGIKPPAGILAGKLAEIFATLAPYDSNSNGTLDPNETQKMQGDIDAGKLTLPTPPK